MDGRERGRESTSRLSQENMGQVEKSAHAHQQQLTSFKSKLPSPDRWRRRSHAALASLASVGAGIGRDEDPVSALLHLANHAVHPFFSPSLSSPSPFLNMSHTFSYLQCAPPPSPQTLVHSTFTTDTRYHTCQNFAQVFPAG